MKKIKNYVMALAALAIAATSFMFLSFDDSTPQNPSSTETLTYKQWTFVGGDPTDANSYIPSTNDLACKDGKEVCQILAPSDGDDVDPKPLIFAPALNDVTHTVRDFIELAIDRSLSNETVTLRD